MEVSSQTPLQGVINAYEVGRDLRFTPSKDFYNRVKINRIRFWQIVKGTTEMSVSEARTLAEYFGIPVTELF